MLKRTSILLLLIAGAIWPRDSLALPGEVVLVKGTTSTPNAAERGYAASLTERLSRWIDELSIQHKVIADPHVNDASLRAAKVVILGYNPNLPDSELSVLRQFIARGGKIIVFYSSDPALAEMMQVRLGEYRSAGLGEYWSAIRINTPAPPNIPPLIRQISHNIRPVYPSAPSGDVLAYWDNKKGENSGFPALVESSHGLWMTHVLLDDGDTATKKGLLLAMIARYVPEVWRCAAERSLQTAGTVGRFASADELLNAVRGMRPGGPRTASMQRSMKRATELRDRSARLFATRDYPGAISAASALRRALIETYALAHGPKRGEFRGVWDHSGTGLYPGDWEKTCRTLAGHGITDLLPNMLWGGLAHYPSKNLPRSSTYRNHGDQIAKCVVAAHRHNIRVHIWKVCWKLDGAPSDFIAAMKRQGRLQKTESGETINWLCPSRADNVKLEVDSLREILEHYAVDGIHLDYIRYKNSSVCCCDGCGKRFEKDTGRKLGRWPDALGNREIRVAFDKWRCGRITHLVREVKSAVSEANPAIELSAAVFGKYPSCVNSVAQDWASWLRNGDVDFVCPMNYTADLVSFGRLVRSQVCLPGAEGKIIPGLGVTAAESRLDPAMVIDQIMLTRSEGVAGFVLFDLNRTLEEETLPILSLGPSQNQLYGK